MVKRRTFFSFHYRPDNWRAAQVRNIGAVAGNVPVSDNDWEAVTKGGDVAIQSWINNQLRGKSCAVVLIGNRTSGRQWIKYEIEKAWNDGKGLLGIYIHNLEDRNGEQSAKGANPFYSIIVNGRRLSNIVKDYDPPYKRSKNVYAHIANNISDWVEEAIRIRGRH